MKTLVFWLLLSGAAYAQSSTIVCNGDSNTQSDWQGGNGWCERLGTELGSDSRTINRGVGGSGIGDNDQSYGTIPLYGGFYLTEEIAGRDPFYEIAGGASVFLGQPTYPTFPAIDVVIFAWGTNDLRAYHYTPQQVIAAIKKYRRVMIAGGATVLVATTPPMFNSDGSLSSWDQSIKKLNQLIRGNWPASYVEFYDGMVAADYQSDGVHLLASGQAKRAQAALDAISRLP